MEKFKTAGEAIRVYRQKRQLTGEQLGRRSGLSQSKISKLETGAVALPREDELRKLMNILDISEKIQQQLLTQLPVPQDRTYKIKAKHPSYRWVINLQKHSKHIRVFCISLIPAFLQTVEYRIALGEHFDFDEKTRLARMKTNVERQDLLWDQSRKFVLLIHEAALYTRIVPKAAQLTQLDRIERFFGLPHITIGILPVRAGLTAAENGTFSLYDKCCIKVIATGDQVTYDAGEILAYSNIFAELEKLAAYEDDARELIRKSMRLYD